MPRGELLPIAGAMAAQGLALAVVATSPIAVVTQPVGTINAAQTPDVVADGTLQDVRLRLKRHAVLLLLGRFMHVCLHGWKGNDRGQI